MTAKEKLTMWVAVIGLVIIALVYFAARSSAQTFGASIDPLQPVGGTGNTVDPDQAAAVAHLCNGAPLNSFGSACYGITWAYDDAGQPVDIRSYVGEVPLVAN